MGFHPNRRGLQVAMVVAGVWLALPLMAPPAHAQAPLEAVRYNEVDLQAEVTREVRNDQLNATMYAEMQHASAAELQSALNRIAADALKAAAEFADVKVHTGYIQTYPVYDRANKLSAWRGRSELRVESRDFTAAAKLIGRLQSSMQLSGVVFSVSPELRRQTERELMEEVVQAFRDRAGVLTQALGGKSYRLRKLSVQTAEGVPPPRPMMMRAAKADMESVPPAFEGGTSQVNVGAVGTIEVE
jgi:predicted secreted protein